MSAHAIAPASERLCAALDAVERPLLREYSAKAIGGHLRDGRFLLSFPRPALGPGPARRLRGIWAALGAPEQAITALDAVQAQAISVHFGFEPEEGGAVLKSYLEFPPPAQPLPGLVFLAAKWRDDGAAALSRYWARDALAPAARHDLLDEVLPDGPARTVLHGFLEEVPAQAGPRFLEVEEPGTPRRSVDLNLADLGLTLAGARDRLVRFLDCSGAEAVLDAHADARLGHLAAGLARDGRPFATLYFGAHRVTGALAP